MTSNSTGPWRPDARFLLRGGAIVFGIGVVVGLLAQFGAGVLRPWDLLLSGFASVLVFFIICGLLMFLRRRLDGLVIVGFGRLELSKEPETEGPRVGF